MKLEDISICVLCFVTLLDSFRGESIIDSSQFGKDSKDGHVVSSFVDFASMHSTDDELDLSLRLLLLFSFPKSFAPLSFF